MLYKRKYKFNILSKLASWASLFSYRGSNTYMSQFTLYTTIDRISWSTTRSFFNLLHDTQKVFTKNARHLFSVALILCYAPFFSRWLRSCPLLKGTIERYEANARVLRCSAWLPADKAIGGYKFPTTKVTADAYDLDQFDPSNKKAHMVPYDANAFVTVLPTFVGVVVNQLCHFFYQPIRHDTWRK